MPKQIDHCDSFYADDVILDMAHSRREILTREAGFEGIDPRKVLARKGLETTREKSANMLLSPNETLQGFFRRTPNGHQAAAMYLKTREKVFRTADDASSAEEEADDQP